MFWNVQGLRTKANEIKCYLDNFDVILMVETFVEKKQQEQVVKLLPCEKGAKNC